MSTPRRTYDNSRRKADAEARQRRIVEAATTLFVEQGFGATSIDQIAAAADVSPQTIYATYGSKAAVLSRAIDVALLGDYEDRSLVDRLPVLGPPGGEEWYATSAQFVRALHERVAGLMRVLEQSASTDPALAELRQSIYRDVRAATAVPIAQIGQTALRPGLSESEATDVMVTIQSPYVYSTLTTDLGWSPDQYETWLARALPRLLLRSELLSE